MVCSMLRPVAVLALLMLSATAGAAEKAEVTAPSTAVAVAWSKEAEQKGSSPTTLNVLLGTYGALTALDMVSTIHARERGGREMNPVMSGGYGQATATKIALAAATAAGVKVIERKSRKAAFVTMIAINAGTALVVANNYRNARHPR